MLLNRTAATTEAAELLQWPLLFSRIIIENDSKLVEVLTCYSKQRYHKMEQLTTISAELKRMDDGRARPRPQQATRPTHRYRLTDRFTPDELNQLVARYRAGEMSAALVKESGIAKPPSCASWLSVVSAPGLAV